MHIVYNKLLSVYAKSSQDNYCGDLSYNTIEAFRQNQFDTFVSCMDNNLQAFENVFKDKLISESLSVFQDDAKGRIPRFKNQSQDDYDLYGEYDIDTILNTPRLSDQVLDYSLYRIHHMFYRCLSFGTNRPELDFDTIDRAVSWFMNANLLDFNHIFSNFTTHFISWQNPVPIFQSLYHHYSEHFTQTVNSGYEKPNNNNNNNSDTDSNSHNTSHRISHNTNTGKHDDYRSDNDIYFLPDTLDLQTWKNTISQIKIISPEKVEQLVEEQIPLFKMAFERAHLYQRLDAMTTSANADTDENYYRYSFSDSVHKIKI